MKIDTTSYYPESPFGSEDEETKIVDSIFSESATPVRKDMEEPVIPSESGDKSEEPDVPANGWELFLNNLSTLLSWLFVPLLMPVYGIILAFELSILAYTGSATKLVFTLIVAGINVLIPSLLVLLLKRAGVVDDIGLNGRKERLVPYIITILCMAGTGIFLWMKMAPMWLNMFYMGGALAGLLNMIINFKWKISAHAAGIAGIVALLVRIMHNGVPMPSVLTWLMIVIGLSGVLGSARVWLGRHTVWQVLAGYAVGFCSVFFLTCIQ